jgi:hypothetical protein
MLSLMETYLRKGEKVETNFRGGCLCGAVRYEAAGDPQNASYCHCDDCKRATGGPYTVGVLVNLSKLRIISGQVRGYTTSADSGRKITRQFCPNCGSPLFTKGEKHPEFVFLKAGSLDEPEVIKPSCQVWTKRAVPWAYIDQTLPRYTEDSQP